MHNLAGQTLRAETWMPKEVLVCRIHGQEFCVDVGSVKEIRGWAPTALLPHSPAYLRGIINLRGTVLPIVDMAARLDFPAVIPSPQSAVIVVLIGKKQVGLLVDAVCDIIEVTADALEATPQLACDTVQNLVVTLINSDDRLIGLLDLDRLLPEIDAGDA
ncbi:MAG TPA: chemotaxis protein CheW [Rhizomicrobium sp.]|nr:chemotaxis protein CheW [Rhizomicrobium sp.]